jgi:hypothetical protein
VFHVDATGQARGMERQLDEAPPFVHRTGDPAASLLGRATPGTWLIEVNKPVIHLTCDVPLAVSIEVLIVDGRPLLAYPKPDDYVTRSRVTRQEFERTLGARAWRGPIQPGANKVVPFDPAFLPARPSVGALDDARIGALDDPREGYPWMRPRHRTVPVYQIPPDDGGALVGNAGFVPRVGDLAGIGLHWQSLIVSPTRLPWMTAAPVPPSPKFAWWNRLREVDCSYVSSRGDSERFVYYDGPARGGPPVRGRVERDGDLGGDVFMWEPAPTAAPDVPRHSIVIDRGGAIVLAPFERAGEPRHRLALGGAPRISAAEAEAWLARALASHGLNAGEAGGLIDCWRDELFKAPGRRLLTVASGPDYEAICPITIRPAPTETARVAVFWTDLPVAPSVAH